ncbi:hypothetical protein BGW42_000802 [Actinomortierella wolfii]|nr:hypothetical protein BGW42_000802 [Actinomortierella wolfii]
MVESIVMEDTKDNEFPDQEPQTVEDNMLCDEDEPLITPARHLESCARAREHQKSSLLSSRHNKDFVSQQANLELSQQFDGSQPRSSPPSFSKTMKQGGSEDDNTSQKIDSSSTVFTTPACSHILFKEHVSHNRDVMGLQKHYIGDTSQHPEDIAAFVCTSMQDEEGATSTFGYVATSTYLQDRPMQRPSNELSHAAEEELSVDNRIQSEKSGSCSLTWSLDISHADPLEDGLVSVANDISLGVSGTAKGEESNAVAQEAELKNLSSSKTSSEEEWLGDLVQAGVVSLEMEEESRKLVKQPSLGMQEASDFVEEERRAEQKYRNQYQLARRSKRRVDALTARSFEGEDKYPRESGHLHKQHHPSDILFKRIEDATALDNPLEYLEMDDIHTVILDNTSMSSCKSDMYLPNMSIVKTPAEGMPSSVEDMDAIELLEPPPSLFAFSPFMPTLDMFSRVSYSNESASPIHAIESEQPAITLSSRFTGTRRFFSNTSASSCTLSFRCLDSEGITGDEKEDHGSIQSEDWLEIRSLSASSGP